MRPALGRPTQPSEIGRINRLVTFATIKYFNPMLDYGCGNEVVTNAIREWGMRVDGEDEHNSGTNIGPYKAATCFDVIEHCDTPFLAMSSIRSRLVDDGILLMTAPNRWWLFETHAARPWNRLPFFNWGPWRHWLRRKVGRNVPCYTKREIRELVEAVGFDVVDIGYQVAPLDNAPWLRRLVWDWHTTKIPFFAVEIYVVAVKRYGPVECLILDDDWPIKIEVKP